MQRLMGRTRWALVAAILAGGALALGFARPASAAIDPAGCAALATQAWPAAQISHAQWTPAGPATLHLGMTATVSVDMPAHCVVQGVTGAHLGRDGKAYGVGFELRLPEHWNGRLYFQGGGGLDGSVLPAFGASSAGPPALARGFAVVSMDGGHEGQDASFADDQQARLDFAYQAVGKATAIAKAVTRRFYAADIARTYFVGCSNGGREAMMAAERYPMEFDGVVAGDPGFRLSRAAVAEAWSNLQWALIAPKAADGKPDNAQALSNADLKLITDKQLEECDALDGLRDGLINNIAACHFSPRQLQCRDGQSGNCLSKAKLDAIEAVMGGAHDRQGRALYSSFPYDTGLSQPDWRVWMLGVPGAMKALNESLGAQSLSLYFMTPQQPGHTPYGMDFDRAAADVAETGAINDPVGTMFSSFSGHGGKLLIYQGQSDPVFSADDIRRWYEGLGRDNADVPGFARLFLIPGMTHCQGGVATDQFDALSAIQRWVEDGLAPDSLIATGKALPGQSRPLCAYPAYARYQAGDPAKAESFACVAPPKTP
jgi:feruloyl esterase